MMSSPRPRRAQGVALIIVLAFVVLLTGLMVAFFTRAVTNRQLSNSSSGQTRAALLARSAADTVVSGFKNEIAAGSTVQSYTGANSQVYKVYTPTMPPTGKSSGTYAVPVRYPTYTSGGNTDAVPNLVRESKSGDNAGGVLAFPAESSYASAVNSSSDNAVGGRNVTTARWNSHYLMPRFSAPTNAPSTPDVFTAPDWVLVNRTGPAVVVNNPSNFNAANAGAVNNSTASNQNYVVGRYAYAVYDEGGLLDMNVAGHPTPGTPAATTGFTATQVGQKGSLALADLTQLPVVSNPTPGSATDYLNQSFVDQIVGWRNYTSAGLSPAAYPNFTFTPAQATSWFKNFAYNNTTGFLNVYTGVTPAVPHPTGPTDQAFLSRQQLLKLRSSLGFSPNVLQYMGTFSRGLEQPSYVPAHILYSKGNSLGAQEAPNIDSLGSTRPPPAGGAEDGYIGNNDQVTYTIGSPCVQDIVNPSFLTIRVKSTFKRADQLQTPAVVGEPLVKKKFPLSRLAEIRYDATDTTASITASSASTQFVALPNNPNARNHIYDWFGLQRSSASAPWTYNHSTATNPGSSSVGLSPHIMTLQEVANLTGNEAREPDFAELLKATINAGSLGKGGPNLQHIDHDNYEYTLDVAVDYQVLQIMANLIDQYDTDSYPTVIQIAFGGIWRTFRGVEDLPYFYRYHPFSVVTQLPIPMLAASDTVSFANAGSGLTINHCATLENVQTRGGFQSGGQMVSLYIPEVWNPHDYYTRLSSATGRPARFRLTVSTDDPALPTPSTTAWLCGAESQTSSEYDDPNSPTHDPIIPPKSSIPAAQKQLVDSVSAVSPTADCTAFTFSDDKGNLFREPTLLWRANYPTNINLTPDTAVAGPYVDANLKNALGATATDSYTYYGVRIGQGAVSYQGHVDQASYPSTPTSASGNFVFQATKTVSLPLNGNKPAGSYLQYTFRLQYLDPNNPNPSDPNSWITYDEKYPDFHSMGDPPLVVNTADQNYTDNGNNPWMNPLQSGAFAGNATGYDPRTPRFGIGVVSEFDENVEPQETVPSIYYKGGSSLANSSMAKSNFTIMYTQRAFNDLGSKVKYSNPAMASDANGGNALEMRWFSGRGYSSAATATGASGWPEEYDGILFGQNDPSIYVPQRGGSNTVNQQLYYEDPDGVARRAMGAYAYSYGGYSASSPVIGNYNKIEGLPLAWADKILSAGIPSGSAGGGASVSGATVQNESRPFVLNRPFRSVAEMGYASRGMPWKQVDFFMPESGDTALLDVFCVNETPADSVVAGKVNINTHQAPVIQALVAGATRDEVNSLPNVTTPYTLSAPTYATGPALTSAEAAGIATTLLGITKNTTNAWQGPLMNIGDLVGHYVNMTNAPAAPDLYTFNETVTNKFYSYAGLSQAAFALPATPTTLQTQTYRIQRMHGSAIRALADSGQTRVWNLLIDIVAQSGRYAPNASTLAQFSVDGESRYWVHVAIDRYTGEIIDKQIELVTE